MVRCDDANDYIHKASINREDILTTCNGPCGFEPQVARSKDQRLNHWAIKVPERPSRLRLAGSFHYSPLFEIRAPWLGPLATKAGNFHSQANPGYRCHQWNGPCGDRTPGHSLHSRMPKPLGHKDTWTTKSLTIGWFVPNHSQFMKLIAMNFDQQYVPLLLAFAQSLVTIYGYSLCMQSIFKFLPWQTALSSAEIELDTMSKTLLLGVTYYWWVESLT